MIIRDILNLKGNAIFSVATDGEVADAVTVMVKHDIGSLVVLDSGKMTGMLTFREVLKGIEMQGGNLGSLAVREVMVRPISCTPDDTLEHLREVMTQNHVRYVLVQEAEQLLGVISFHDIAKAVIKETNFENRLLKRYIKNWPEEESAQPPQS